MCVGVTVWFGWGGVVSLCGLKQSFKLNATERRAWKEIENVCRKFRGNDKAENCTEIVQELVSPDSVMGCNTSLKVVVSLCRLKQSFSLHKDTTPPQSNHTVTPTHIEPEQYNP